MVIKLLPMQIPKFWEHIKYSVANANQLQGEELPLYCNRLLASLLNSYAQCFIRVDENKQLLAILITRLVGDEITGKQSLFIESLYSFQRVLDSEWAEDMKIIVEFATANKCNYITTYTQLQRVVDIITPLGFKERFKCLYMEV